MPLAAISGAASVCPAAALMAPSSGCTAWFSCRRPLMPLPTCVYDQRLLRRCPAAWAGQLPAIWLPAWWQLRGSRSSGCGGGGAAHPTAAALAGLTASHLALPALYPADSHSPRRAPRCARLPPAGLQPLLHLLLPAFAAFHACLLDTPLICFALPAARLAGHKGWVTSIAAPLDPSADVLLSSSR